VQAEQRARDDAEQQGGDGDRHHDRPVVSQCADSVLVDHRPDVDTQHTLRGDTTESGYPGGRQRGQRQHDADDQRGEQGGRRHADAGERDGDGDRHCYQ